MDFEIPVVFNGSQKWITGLSRSTTCDDVIYALLRHNQGPNDSIDVSEYRMYEEWKDFTRTLSGRTRIIKLWRLYGSKSRNVRLVIRYAPQSADVFDTGSEMSYNTRHRRARRLTKTNPRSSPSNMTKAEIFQYYRRERNRKSLTESDRGVQMEDMYSLASVISKQQEELNDLSARNNALDSYINGYDYEQHSHGGITPNVHQLTHDTSMFPILRNHDLEGYHQMIECVLAMHEQIEQTHSKACYLTSVIADEQQTMETTPDYPKELLHEIDKKQKQIIEELEQCQTISVIQQNELQLLDNALQQCDRSLFEREQELVRLNNEIDELEQEDANTSPIGKYVSDYFHSERTHLMDKQNRQGSYNNTEQPTMKSSSSISRDTHSRHVPDVVLNTNAHTCDNLSQLVNDCFEERLNEVPLSYTNSLQEVPLSYSSSLNEVPLSNRNSSPKKHYGDQTKGVRFNANVTEWMYDVMSEDESQIEGSNMLQSSSKYSPLAITAFLNQRNIACNSNNKISQKTTKQPLPLPPSPTPTQEIPFYDYKMGVSSDKDKHTWAYHVKENSVTYISNVDDSNSDTGLSSMNSEEDVMTPPLETLV